MDGPVFFETRSRSRINKNAQPSYGSMYPARMAIKIPTGEDLEKVCDTDATRVLALT